MENFFVIVGSPAGLSSVQNPVFHGFFRALQKDASEHLDFVSNMFLPKVDVRLVSWVSVENADLVLVEFEDVSFDEVDCGGAWDEVSFGDIAVNLDSEFGTGFDFGS